MNSIINKNSNQNHYYVVCIPGGVEENNIFNSLFNVVSMSGILGASIKYENWSMNRKRKYYRDVVSQFETYLKNNNIKYKFYSYKCFRYICSYFCTNKVVDCKSLDLPIQELEASSISGLPIKDGPPVHQAVMGWFGVEDCMSRDYLPEWNIVYGAILGDIYGSHFEGSRHKELAATKKFQLIYDDSRWTDDTCMTIAVLEALLDGYKNYGKTKECLIKSMKKYGRKYSNAGYGQKFYEWIFSDDNKPYKSYGNGSAMRVSSVGALYDNLHEVLKYAKLTAEVTHNHPEAIKGAQAVAHAIYLARNTSDKFVIKDIISKKYGYNLNRKLEDIRPTYFHDTSCQNSVPEAIIAFLESTSYIDAVKNAISLGGDADTQACIAGAIAGAYYYDFDSEDFYANEIVKKMPDDLINVLKRFHDVLIKKYPFYKKALKKEEFDY